MDLTALLFSFRGRISRKPYWQCICVALFLDMAVSFVTVPFDGFVQGAAQAGLLAALAWPMLALQAKRWHDRDKSAWWLLINLIPYVGVIWVIVECGILRGTEGTNRFGPDSLGGAGASGASGDVVK